MSSDDDKQKAIDFVNHLFSNPNISSEPPLIGEGLILNFIAQNIQQLKATFKTGQFFPHLEWNQALQLVISELYNRVSEEALPVVTSFIESADMEVINKVIKPAQFPATFHRDKLQNFIPSIFKNKDVRYHFNSVINILKYEVLEKYLGEIFNRHDFLYNELVRVQKTYLEADEYITFMKLLLLIKNAAYIKIPLETGSDAVKVSIIECLSAANKFKKYSESFLKYIKQNMPNLSDNIIDLALKANVRENKTELENSSSRLLFIFTARYQTYKPQGKIDRGAEAPDKSWFGIARKNAEYYGYNKRMIDELYRIAGDNNW